MFRRDTKDKNDHATGSLIGRTRKRRSGHAVFVSFNIPKVPSKPREKAIKFLEVKFLNGQQLELIKKVSTKTSKNNIIRLFILEHHSSFFFLFT